MTKRITSLFAALGAAGAMTLLGAGAASAGQSAPSILSLSAETAKPGVVFVDHRRGNFFDRLERRLRRAERRERRYRRYQRNRYYTDENGDLYYFRGTPNDNEIRAQLNRGVSDRQIRERYRDRNVVPGPDGQLLSPK